jgi:hypothetical protein
MLHFEMYYKDFNQKSKEQAAAQHQLRGGIANGNSSAYSGGRQFAGANCP